MRAKVCKSCQSDSFRRMKRSGWLDLGLMTWLGFYPWECASCRSKHYFHDHGRRPSDRGHIGL